MRELTRTKETPKKPGFYWYWGIGDSPTILYVVDPLEDGHLKAYEPMDEFHPMDVERLDGQWAGPLEAPP